MSKPNGSLATCAIRSGIATYAVGPARARPPSTDLRTDVQARHRGGDDGRQQAGDHPAREFVPEIQPLRQAAHPEQHDNRNKGRRRQRREPVRRHAGPFDELWKGQQQKHQSVIEVVGRRERAQVDERPRVQSHERGGGDRRLIASRGEATLDPNRDRGRDEPERHRGEQLLESRRTRPLVCPHLMVQVRGQDAGSIGEVLSLRGDLSDVRDVAETVGDSRRQTPAMQSNAARAATRLRVTTKAGKANTGYIFAVAPSSTRIGLTTRAGLGNARHRRIEAAISENSAMSMFARSTANMIAGEHAASASTMPVPTGTRPTSNLNDRNMAAIKTAANANVCDWSSPSAPRRSQGRRYISGRPHGSHGLSYSGSYPSRWHSQAAVRLRASKKSDGPGRNAEKWPEVNSPQDATGRDGRQICGDGTQGEPPVHPWPVPMSRGGGPISRAAPPSRRFRSVSRMRRGHARSAGHGSGRYRK